MHDGGARATQRSWTVYLQTGGEREKHNLGLSARKRLNTGGKKKTRLSRRYEWDTRGFELRVCERCMEGVWCQYEGESLVQNIHQGETQAIFIEKT